MKKFNNDSYTKDFLRTTSRFIKFDLENLLRIHFFNIEGNDLKLFREWEYLGIGINQGEKAYMLSTPYLSGNKIIERDIPFFSSDQLNKNSYALKSVHRELIRDRNYISFHNVINQIDGLITSTHISNHGFMFEEVRSLELSNRYFEIKEGNMTVFKINSSLNRVIKLRMLLMLAIAYQLHVDYNLDLNEISMDESGYVNYGLELHSIIGLSCLYVLDAAFNLNNEKTMSFDLLSLRLQRRNDLESKKLLNVIIKTSQRVYFTLKDSWTESLLDVESSQDEERY